MNKEFKTYKEFINEKVATSIPWDAIELIKKDVARSKDFIQSKVTSLEELAEYLTMVTKKYDVVFHTYKDFPELEGSPAFHNSKDEQVHILLQPDVLTIKENDTKWNNWMARLEDSLVHEMTHQQDSLNPKRPFMEGSDLEDDIKYFSTFEEIRAYANEQMNKFQNQLKWNKEKIERTLQEVEPVDHVKGQIWNVYLKLFKGTDTFEWFLKCCYEYLDRYVKQ